MAFSGSWSDLPEVEVAPNNFRRSVSGLGVGVNLIRWVHPSGTPPHVHADTEKAVVVLEGRMEWSIGDEVVELGEGSVAVVPRGVAHHGRTVGTDVRFLEAFAPARIQNLVGFLGVGLLADPPPAGGGKPPAGEGRDR